MNFFKKDKINKYFTTKGICFKPRKWNQVGFIYQKKRKKIVRFVKVINNAFKL